MVTFDFKKRSNIVNALDCLVYLKLLKKKGKVESLKLELIQICLIKIFIFLKIVIRLILYFQCLEEQTSDSRMFCTYKSRLIFRLTSLRTNKRRLNLSVIPS